MEQKHCLSESTILEICLRGNVNTGKDKSCEMLKDNGRMREIVLEARRSWAQRCRRGNDETREKGRMAGRGTERDDEHILKSARSELECLGG
jgi:hypothetical protein